MDNKIREEKIQAIAEKAKKLGFSNFAVLCWDADGDWAATVSTGITIGQLRGAATLFDATAKQLEGGKDG